MSIYTIYCITNLVNSKVYIGYTSKSSEIRFKSHISSMNCKRNLNKFLYRAFRKYGIENFICDVLYQSKDKFHITNNMEQYFINEYKSMNDEFGYNMCIGGQGGDIKSNEQKLMSKTYTGGEKCSVHKIMKDKSNYDEWLNKIHPNRKPLRPDKAKLNARTTPCSLYYMGVHFVFNSIIECELFCKKRRIGWESIQRKGKHSYLPIYLHRYDKIYLAHIDKSNWFKSFQLHDFKL